MTSGTAAVRAEVARVFEIAAGSDYERTEVYPDRTIIAVRDLPPIQILDHIHPDGPNVVVPQELEEDWKEPLAPVVRAIYRHWETP